MNPPRRRRLDVVLDDAFLADLDQVSVDELRRRRELVDQVEVELSYHRRLLHGRLDILDFELRRRRGEETRTILEALPEILVGSDTTGGGKGRLVRGGFAPEIPAETGRREVDRALDDTFLVDIADTPDEELLAIRDLLVETEQAVSESRRRVHDTHDRVVAALRDRFPADRVD